MRFGHSESCLRQAAHWKDGSNRIKRFDEFSADVVEVFLRSLYSGGILLKAFELFSIAQAYEVFELKSFAENIIINNLDKTNAMKAFKLGHLSKSETLIGASFKKIQRSILKRSFRTR